MHELAGCRVLASAVAVDGYVTSYTAGVLRLSLEAPLVGRLVGDHVTVVVLDPVRGECSYRGLIGGGVGTDVDVVVVETLDRLQRRGAARAGYQVPCVALVHGDDGAQTMAVSVIDVSATGLRFSSRRHLKVGTEVTVRLPEGGDVLEVRARVVRGEAGPRSTWRHGCEIVGSDERTKDRLYRLVARLQREEARRASAARD